MRFPSFAWDGMPSLRIPLKRVLRKYQPFTPQSPATYSIGLSYASKNSPPFIPPYAEAPRYGFANLRDANGFIPKVTAFVEDCLSRQAGRGVLNETAVGGWDDKISVETRRWGAGEDFFCIADREWTVSMMITIELTEGGRLCYPLNRTTSGSGDFRWRWWMGRYCRSIALPSNAHVPVSPDGD